MAEQGAVLDAGTIPQTHFAQLGSNNEAAHLLTLQKKLRSCPSYSCCSPWPLHPARSEDAATVLSTMDDETVIRHRQAVNTSSRKRVCSLACCKAGTQCGLAHPH